MFAFDRDAHIYRFGGRIIPGATDVLRDAGFKGPDGNMDMGRAVHLATELYDTGELDPLTVSDEVFGYLEGWVLFRKETGFKPTRIEEPNVNAALMIAATLDREGTWDRSKGRVLVEIKKYEPPYFTGLQLAIQELTLPVLPLPRQRIGVQLNADGTYNIHEYKNRDDRNMAAFLVSLYWYKKNKGD